MEETVRFATFIVRASRGPSGKVSGVLICVRTGERTAFRGAGHAGMALELAIERETRLSAPRRGEYRRGGKP